MTEDLTTFPERFGLLKGAKIDDDCPHTMRVGLWHAIARAVDKGRTGGWTPVAQEILRLNREQASISQGLAWKAAAEKIHSLRWDLVYVLCERIYEVILQPEFEYDINGNGEEVVSLSQVRREFEADVNQALAEDNSAYRMRQGTVYRPGRSHSRKLATRAGVVLQDPNLRDARIHYQKAVRFFSDLESSDFENCIKEAISALEAASRALFPDLKGGLDKVLRQIRDEEGEAIPPTVVKGILAPFYFRGDGKGIAHGNSSGGKASARLAEWVLSVVAASIILLKDISDCIDEEPPPF